MSRHETRLDVRDLPPAQRHERIHDAFAALDAGETLVVVNDHDPAPLYYEFAAEVDAFDGDAYQVREEAADRFVATFPKR
jgi:uncharacterized protein (DUF2249 family)